MRPPSLVAVVLAAALLLVGCGPGEPPLARLAAAVPDEAVAPEGLLLRTGADGARLLAAALGLDTSEVRATATTGTPALRVLLADAPDLADRLGAEGFAPVAAPEGWVVLERPASAEGYVGVPAVAVGEGLVAVGAPSQLQVLAAGGPPVPLPDEALAGAVVARVLPGPLGAPPLPPVAAAAATADGQGGGRLSVRLADPGEQADAVALSVLLRTGAEVPVGAALTREDVVSVELGWPGGDAGAVLSGPLEGTPLGVLAGS